MAVSRITVPRGTAHGRINQLSKIFLLEGGLGRHGWQR